MGLVRSQTVALLGTSHHKDSTLRWLLTISFLLKSLCLGSLATGSNLSKGLAMSGGRMTQQSFWQEVRGVLAGGEGRGKRETDKLSRSCIFTRGHAPLYSDCGYHILKEWLTTYCGCRSRGCPPSCPLCRSPGRRALRSGRRLPSRSTCRSTCPRQTPPSRGRSCRKATH